MERTIAAIHLNPVTVSFLRKELAGAEILTGEDDVSGLDALFSRRPEIGMAVLGPGLRDPIQCAQRVRSFAREIPIVIVTPPERLEQVRRAIFFAPFLDQRVLCVSDADPRALLSTLSASSLHARQRRGYIEAISAANRRLDGVYGPRETEHGREYFDRLLDYAPIGIAALDDEGRVVLWNRAAAELTGKNEHEALGANLPEVFPHLHASDRDRLLEALRDRNNRYEANPPFTVAGRAPGQDLCYYEITLGPVRGRFRQRGTMVLFQDITARRKNEEELMRAKSLAESANLSKSNFLANMSHEIRTPLGAVIGFAELLASGTHSDPEKEAAIASINRNSQLLLRLIDDILDLSKVDAGRLDIFPAAADLPRVLNDVLATMEPRARESGLALVAGIDGFVPRQVRTDPVRLKQILINIIGNAIKFTASGTIRLIGRTDMAPGGPATVVLRVSDQGPGIPPEKADRLFRPFEQIDASLTRRYGGTGLGLALSRRLAQALGGDVRLVDSRVGEGSTFQITLPFDPGAGFEKVTDLGRTAPAAPVPAPKGLRLDGIRVLLVEDSVDNQQIVSRYLRLAGATIEIAENGREGVEKCLAADYDLVLMDLQMPVMDGFAALAELKKAGYPVPTVALTAHAMSSEREKCLALGFAEHLAKPVDRQLLLTTVQDLARPDRP